MPLATAHLDELRPARLIVCEECDALYDGKTILHLENGSIARCSCPKENGSPCNAELGRWGGTVINGRATRVVPRKLYSYMDLAAAIGRLWEMPDFAAHILNNDPRRTSSFFNTQRFQEVKKLLPALAMLRGTLFFTMYIDWFSFHANAADPATNQVGSVWLRIDGLPPSLAIRPEYSVHVATLIGARFFV
jgi:hypothetical protein